LTNKWVRKPKLIVEEINVITNFWYHYVSQSLSHFQLECLLYVNAQSYQVVLG